MPEFNAQPDGFDDIDLQTGVVNEVADAGDIYGESESMEDLAGMPEGEKEVPELDNATTPEGPPVPESGLPEGWTMDQWKWYGQQWLDSQK